MWSGEGFQAGWELPSVLEEGWASLHGVWPTQNHKSVARRLGVQMAAGGGWRELLPTAGHRLPQLLVFRV